MQGNISQQDIAIFSSDPSGVKEAPQGSQYTDGVDVGYTAPAKWWNWFWNKLTAWCTASKADRVAVHTETINTLSAASIVPSGSDEHQLSKAVDVLGYAYCGTHDNETVTETVGGVSVTHPVNKPYVVGNTLYIPATELL